MSLIKIKASLSKSFHIQPSEIDAMPMWEYELYIKQLNEMIEEENEKQQKDMDQYRINDYKKMANPRNLSKMTQPPDIPKMNFGNMNTFK